MVWYCVGMKPNCDALIDLIELSRSQREKAESQAVSFRDRLAELETTITQLNQEEQSFLAALNRYFPEAVAGIADEKTFEPEKPQPITQDGVARLGRSEAVELAVQSITRKATTASPEAIEEFLHASGRTDTRDQIGAALAYLNRSGRVERLARAQWRLVSTG